MPSSTHHHTLSHDSILESLSALLTQLYTLHLSLPSTLPSNFGIIQPPHFLSPALLSNWKEAGMSDIVIETLKRLPYLSSQPSSGSREIAPDTLALDYLDEDGEAVDVWKDPFCLACAQSKEGAVEAEERAKRKGYLGNAIPLTSCIGINGCLLILDLDSSTYFTLSPSHSSPYPLHHLFSSPSFSTFFPTVPLSNIS